MHWLQRQNLLLLPFGALLLRGRVTIAIALLVKQMRRPGITFLSI
jgi:hypothetical protein